MSRMGIADGRCIESCCFLLYRFGHFKDTLNLKSPYKIEFWSDKKKTPEMKRSRLIESKKNVEKFRQSKKKIGKNKKRFEDLKSN